MSKHVLNIDDFLNENRKSSKYNRLNTVNEVRRNKHIVSPARAAEILDEISEISFQPESDTDNSNEFEKWMMDDLGIVKPTFESKCDQVVDAIDDIIMDGRLKGWRFSWGAISSRYKNIYSLRLRHYYGEYTFQIKDNSDGNLEVLRSDTCILREENWEADYDMPSTRYALELKYSMTYKHQVKTGKDLFDALTRIPRYKYISKEKRVEDLDDNWNFLNSKEVTATELW